MPILSSPVIVRSPYRRFSVNCLTPILNSYQTKVAQPRVIFPEEHDLTIKRALATVVFENSQKYRFLAYFWKKSEIRSGQPDLKVVPMVSESALVTPPFVIVELIL